MADGEFKWGVGKTGLGNFDRDDGVDGEESVVVEWGGECCDEWMRNRRWLQWDDVNPVKHEPFHPRIARSMRGHISKITDHITLEHVIFQATMIELRVNLRKDVGCNFRAWHKNAEDG